MKQIQNLIDDMYNGNTDAILSGISSNNDFLLINAIIAGTKQGVKEDKFIEGITKAQESEAILLGFPIASIATASSHLLQKKKYTGDDVIVKELLESKFDI